MVAEGSRRAPYAAALGATVLSGLLTYAFLAFVSRSLTASAFDDFSVFWSLALLVGFGLFVPLEQELARSRTSGGDDRLAVHETLVIGFGLAAVAAVALVVLAVVRVIELPPTVLVAAVLVALLSPVQYAAKGRLVQSDRILAHSVATVVENVVRTAAAACAFVLALSAGRSGDAAPMTLAVVAALLAAYAWVLVPLIGRPRIDAGDLRRRGRVILAILVPSLAGQALLNSGPLVIDALVSTPGVTGAFQATFNLARLPLFVVLPLQAVLIGRMAPLIEGGRARELRSALSTIALGVVALAGVGGVVGAWIGPWIVGLLFGPGRALAPLETGLLVAAVCIYVGLVVNTQALIVSSRTRAAAWAWVVAVIAAGAALLVTLQVVAVPLAVCIALLSGAAVGWVSSIVQIRWRTAHPAS